MTARKAVKQSKKELEQQGVEALAAITKAGISTYNIALAHSIAEKLNWECDEVMEGKKVRYVIYEKPKPRRKTVSQKQSQ